jgi:hypothetical protein
LREKYTEPGNGRKENCNLRIVGMIKGLTLGTSRRDLSTVGVNAR